MSSFPAANYLSDAARTVAEMKTALEQQLAAIKQLPGAQAQGAVTLSANTSGTVAPTVASFTVDTHASASTGDLANIDPSAVTFVAGNVIFVSSANSARTVVVKNGAGGAGQITTADGADFSLTDPSMLFVAELVGTTWVELFRGYGKKTAAQLTFLGTAALPIPGSSDPGRIAKVKDDYSGYELAGPLVSFKNRLINGDMRIDQRNEGASLTPTADAYTVDRWKALLPQASKLTFQRLADGTFASVGLTYATKISVASAATVASGDDWAFVQRIEGFNIADAGFGASGAKSIAVSFYTYANNAGTYSGAIRNSATNRCYPFSFAVAATTVERHTIVIPGDTAGTWLADSGIGLELCLDLGAGTSARGTAGAWAAAAYVGVTSSFQLVATASAYLYVTGAQLEVGPACTAFDRRDYGTELRMCQRYLQKSYEVGTVPGTATHVGLVSLPQVGATTNAASLDFKLPMRAAPTVTLWDGAGNVGAMSYGGGSGGTWNDNNGATTVFDVTTKNAHLWTTSAATIPWFHHYRLDAEL